MEIVVAISRGWSYNYGVVEIDRMKENTKIETMVREAASDAYDAGKQAGIQLGIEMGLQRAMDITSRDLHNFKFPESQRVIDMPLEQHAPKDNSTFEFTYKTYEERVLAKEAESAAEREARTVNFNARRRSNKIVADNRKQRYAKNAPSMEKLWKYAPVSKVKVK